MGIENIMKSKQLKSSDIKKLKKFLHKKNNAICPVLKVKVDLNNMVVDHSHSANARILKTDDGGLVRGIMHRGANIIEGKITNAFIRTGLHKIDNINIPSLLRNLADYLEDKTISKKQYIHPSEKPKVPTLSKRNFNILVKLYTKKYPNRKKLQYPKSKKLTKKLIRVYDEFNLDPVFLK